MATIQDVKMSLQHYGEQHSQSQPQQQQQHYISGNGHSVSGVITVAVQPDGAYVPTTQVYHSNQQQQAHQLQQQHAHQMQQQHQNVQMMPPKPTTILNHMLASSAAASTNHQLKIEVSPAPTHQQPAHYFNNHPHHPQQQQQQQVHQHPQKMWLLVEWEMPPGEPNAYSVIDSSELVLHSNGAGTPPDARETIHTGKTIYVRRGKKLHQATVVFISEDKQFVEDELRQLRKMAVESTHNKSYSSATQEHHQQASNGLNGEPYTKRRKMERLSGSEENGGSTANSQEYDPIAMVVNQQQQQQGSNSGNNSSSNGASSSWICKPERVITPSPSVISAGNGNGLSKRIPSPMTFDQQTQTDSSFFMQTHDSQRNGQWWQQEQLAKLVSIHESMLAEQQTNRSEMECNRKVIQDMVAQVKGVIEIVGELAAKIDGRKGVSVVEEHQHQTETESAGSYVVLEEPLSEESRDREVESFVVSEQRSSRRASNAVDGSLIQVDSFHVEESSNLSFRSNSSSNHVHAHTVNTGGHENIYHHNQHRQHHRQEDISSSTPKNFSHFSKRLSSSALSLSNASVASNGSEGQSSSGIEGPKPITGIVTGNGELLLAKDDEAGGAGEGDDSEMIMIGPNRTLVRRQILRAINWTNYKAATRKLLMTLFSRHILATHTLTGRPSPAFMGDRAKPVKDKLDQKIIADIIAVVTKTCNVSEPMVRTAITTKCADENKMSRMKSDKHSASTAQATDSERVVKLIVESAEAESDARTQPMLCNGSATITGRRIKRENKENVN